MAQGTEANAEWVPKRPRPPAPHGDRRSPREEARSVPTGQQQDGSRDLTATSRHSERHSPCPLVPLSPCPLAEPIGFCAAEAHPNRQ